MNANVLKYMNEELMREQQGELFYRKLSSGRGI